MENKWYVVMTDKFLSGWGKAQGKIAKLVIECDSRSEAEIVYENAKNRDDMKYVNIAKNKPSYNKSSYQVSYENKDTYGKWFEQGAF